MSLLSGTVSITRYKVLGKIEAPITENIANGLVSNTIAEIDNQISDIAIGWTSFDKPFQPNFGGSSFVYGSVLCINRLLFLLRFSRWRSISTCLLLRSLRCRLLIDCCTGILDYAPELFDLRTDFS